MKPKLFLAAVALFSISVSSFAQKSKPTEAGSKVMRLQHTITSLTIDNDITVILTEGSDNDIVVKGEISQINKFAAQEEDNKLFLSYSQPNEKPEIQVFMPARYLNKIVVNGKAELKSAAVLHNTSIRVVVDGESKIYLRSIGKVTVEGTSEYDFIKGVK